MKYIKILGLAAVAAMALMAFVGAGTASADALCTTLTEGGSEAGCTTGQQEYSGTITASLVPGTEAVLKGPVAIKCKASSVTGTIGSATGEPIMGEITALSFTNCNTCKKIEAQSLPYTVDAEATSGGNGVMNVTSPKVLLEKCTILQITCTATAGNVELEVTGGHPAIIHAKEEELSLGACGNGTWTADYEITTPTAAMGLWLEP